MPLEISTEDRLDLGNLYDWLSHDPRVARIAAVSLASSGATTGEQGALDVIEVVLGNATAIAGLAISFAGWRQARRHDTKVVFRVGRREVTVSSEDPEVIEELLRKLNPETGGEHPGDAD